MWCIMSDFIPLIYLVVIVGVISALVVFGFIAARVIRLFRKIEKRQKEIRSNMITFGKRSR